MGKNKKEERAAKRAERPHLSKETKRRFLKKGSYSFTLCVIVFAIVVALNLVAGQLPASLNQRDISSQKLYSLSDQTKDVLAALKEDVTIYLLASSGSEDDILMKTLQQYENESKHIKVAKKDPDLYPTFASEYTEDTLSVNSMIVVCGEKSRTIDYQNIYETSLDYTTYQSQTTGFDGEGQITSAIRILTSEDVPVLYTLTGHDELELDTSLLSLIEKENVSVESLNLLTQETVPEDCSMLLILSPTKDLSSEDAEKITAYMEKGGKAMIVPYYNRDEMPNLEAVMKAYGVGVEDSIILEEDSSYYAMSNPYYIIPEIENTDYTTDLTQGKSFVLAPISQPVLQGEASDTITYTTLLSSSGSAYAKHDAEKSETLAYVEGDEKGPFAVAVAAEKTEEEVTSKMVVLGTEALFDATLNAQVSGSNYTLILNIISRLAEHETTTAIPVKSLTYEPLSVTAAEAILWRNVFLFGIPLLLLATGVVIWYRRRKR